MPGETSSQGIFIVFINFSFYQRGKIDVNGEMSRIRTKPCTICTYFRSMETFFADNSKATAVYVTDDESGMGKSSIHG